VGYSLDEDDGTCSEYEELLERSDLGWMIFQIFVYKRFCSRGANPLHVMPCHLRGTRTLSSGRPRADAEKMGGSLWKFQ